MPFKPLSQRLKRDLCGGEISRNSGVCALLDTRTISWPANCGPNGYQYARHPATLGFHLPNVPRGTQPPRLHKSSSEIQEDPHKEPNCGTTPLGVFQDAPNETGTPSPSLPSMVVQTPTPMLRRESTKSEPCFQEACGDDGGNNMTKRHALINFPKYMLMKDSHLKRRDLQIFSEQITSDTGEPPQECQPYRYDWDPRKILPLRAAGSILPTGRACRTSNPFRF